jgi:hypothetical protein
MTNLSHREDLMAIWVWVLIVSAAVVVIALLAMGAVRPRTAALRKRFGPEYDRTVAARGDRRAAEAELRERERRRAQFDIKPLPEHTRLRFADEWREVQERFVDQPAQAVAAAGALIAHVMEARGYPTSDFEAGADLISVDYPAVVEDYRFAHAVGQRTQTQQASTEDLREALLRYRSLFDELLRPKGTRPAAPGTGQAGISQAPAGTRAGTRGQPPGPAGDGTDTAASEPAEEAAAPAADRAGPETGDQAYEEQLIHRSGR